MTVRVLPYPKLTGDVALGALVFCPKCGQGGTIGPIVTVRYLRAREGLFARIFRRQRAECLRWRCKTACGAVWFTQTLEGRLHD